MKNMYIYIYIYMHPLPPHPSHTLNSNLGPDFPQLSSMLPAMVELAKSSTNKKHILSKNNTFSLSRTCGQRFRASIECVLFRMCSL